MPDPRFDASSAVTFDLAHGRVQIDGATPRLLVPAAALAELSADAQSALGGAIGREAGRRAASRLHAEAGGVRAASIDAVVEHLAGELALVGAGELGLERWGRALVFVVDRSPLGAAGDRLVEGLLEGMLREATGQSLSVRAVHRDGERARFLATGSRAAEQVDSWLAEGATWAEALVRLHGSRAAAAEGGR